MIVNYDQKWPWALGSGLCTFLRNEKSPILEEMINSCLKQAKIGLLCVSIYFYIKFQANIFLSGYYILFVFYSQMKLQKMCVPMIYIISTYF